MDDTRNWTTGARPEGDRTPAGDVSPHAVIEALARLIAVAAVYPRDHPRIAAIVEPVLGAVRMSAAAGQRFSIRVPKGASPDPTMNAPAQRLLRDLDALGISRVDIEREVSSLDLFALARFLRQHAPNNSGALFRHLDFRELPWTVRVEERSFGLPSFRDDEAAPDAPDDAAGDALRSFRGPLVLVDAETVALVRTAVRAALRGQKTAFARAMAASRIPVTESEATRASAEAVRAWIERHNPALVATRTPAEILADAERTLPRMLPGVQWTPVLDGIRRVIDEYLRDSFSTETPAEFDTKRTVAPKETAAEHASKADLARAIAEFVTGAEPFGAVGTVDRPEHLSNLLHLLGETATRGETEGVVRRLGSALAGTPGPGERGVLVGWLRDVAVNDGSKEMDGRLVPVFGALRLAGGGIVADLLLETCAGQHAGLAVAFWPHLAYEMITADDPGAAGRRKRLESMVAAMPAARMRDEARRLSMLIALRPRPASPDALCPPRLELYPLYEVLLDTPREIGLASAVTAAFIQVPPAHPAAGALAALAPSEERAQRFVARLLREGDVPSTAMRALAVEILVGSLRSLPRARRGEAWVHIALHALAKLPCVETLTMLQEVKNARSLWVRWEWPIAVRRQAAKAMGVHSTVPAADAPQESAP